MPYLYRGWRPVAALFLVCLFPAVASAQDTGRLKLPTFAASAAAAADWASTYHTLKHYRVREMNPMLQRFDRTPGRLVTVGAAIDAAAFSTWNLTVGPKHPRLAAAGLWAMAGFRTYLVIHNLRNAEKAGRR